jgi:hypothetical protein
MGFAGYVTVCVQLYCASFHCLSLHASAYMAIFKCVGYFYFHMSEEFCFATFFAFFSRGHTLHVSICVFLWCFLSLILLLLALFKFSRQVLSPFWTNTHARSNKFNLVKQTQKDTNGNVQCENTWKKGKKSSEAKSFRHMKIKISYTFEDGHVGRNM